MKRKILYEYYLLLWWKIYQWNLWTEIQRLKFFSRHSLTWNKEKFNIQRNWLQWKLKHIRSFSFTGQCSLFKINIKVCILLCEMFALIERLMRVYWRKFEFREKYFLATKISSTGKRNITRPFPLSREKTRFDGKGLPIASLDGKCRLTTGFGTLYIRHWNGPKKCCNVVTAGHKWIYFFPEQSCDWNHTIVIIYFEWI